MSEKIFEMINTNQDELQMMEVDEVEEITEGLEKWIVS